jgi:hypothetical protein
MIMVKAESQCGLSLSTASSLNNTFTTEIAGKIADPGNYFLNQYFLVYVGQK